LRVTGGDALIAYFRVRKLKPVLLYLPGVFSILAQISSLSSLFFWNSEN
jgi:hypothetical protein